jgi:alpha-mannosidase
MGKYIKCLALLALGMTFDLIVSGQNYDTKSTLPGDKDGKKDDKRITGVENVIIVYKTHFDIGYSETVQQVLHDYRTSMADRVLEAIDKNSNQPREKQFVWTISGWPMKQILWEGQIPERKKKIEQAIHDGNLAIHAFPFTMHTETSDVEDLVRGLNISSTLARKYGQTLSISAKMSDVPGQSWFIPTLFTHAGIKFYHMGGPVVNIGLGLPPLFWWEGPDGSRLLTLYNNGYGSDPLPPDTWPYKTWIYINMTGDNQGPPDPETVAKDLEYYTNLGIKAMVGKMDDFADMILREDLSKLPVIRTDIGDVWIHGTMSMPEASKMALNIRPSITGLDELTTLEAIWGIHPPDLKNVIADAFEQSLLYSEHTWGLANQHYLKVPYGEAWLELWKQGLPPQYKLMEKSWGDHAGYISNVQKLVENPYQDAIASLADNVRAEGNRMVVYNPLPWTRSGAIELDTRLIFGNDFVSLSPIDGGSALPVSHEYQAIEGKAPMSRFVVKDIPPMGYRTYVASVEKAESPELSADKKTGVIESPFFKATIDARRGRITSLIDKNTGQELVDDKALQGFGQYFYERFGYKEISGWIRNSLYDQYKAHKLIFAAYDMPRDGVYSSALPENMKLTYEKSAIDVRAVMTGTIPVTGNLQEITISLTLSGMTPVADIEVSWQKLPDSWPEAAWICLPFKVDNPSYRLGRIGADVDPVKDMITDNANYHLWWVNTGVAVYNQKTGKGIGICSRDAPLVCIGEPGEYQFDKHYIPEKPYIYLNLYNNHWRTNFPAWIGNGQRMSARVRIWTYDKFSAESSLYTPGMETRVPLQVACSRVKNGKLPVKQSGVSLSRKGIALTAFGPNPDGKGTVLRVWEQSGITGKLEVTLPAGSGFSTAEPVNLRGEKLGEPVNIISGRIIIDLNAYSPASYVLE